MRSLILFLAVLMGPAAGAQFAPQAGVSGSTAIHANSPQIVGWGTSCSIKRGYLNIAQPANGKTSAGDSTAGIGAVDHFIVSLGDSGVATIGFAQPIVNGNGPDLAVFENGFVNPANSEEAFLELAFVEVSSNGVDFHRFPAASYTQTDTQIAGAGIYMDARKLNNLAGKYVSNYGTPFDLDDLAGIPGLNINQITHVRLVDVVGSVDGHSSYDTAGRMINDPYPTDFPIGGFDLDAVGVLHQGNTSGLREPDGEVVNLFPNPSSSLVTLTSTRPVSAVLKDVTGKQHMELQVRERAVADLSLLQPGIYFWVFENKQGQKWASRFIKQ